MDIFSNAMAMFWIFVQQVCLCFIKLAYEKIMERPRRARLCYVVQGAAFVGLMIFAFDLMLGVSCFWRYIPREAWPFYGRLKWNFLCWVMLVLDALLVAYGWRIYKLYTRGADKFALSSPLRVAAEDLAIVAVFLAPFIWYHMGMTSFAIRYGLPDEDVRTLQFFFIKIANFFYAFFEGTAAVLIWKVYRSAGGTEARRECV